MPDFDRGRALELLRTGSGRSDAEFRDGQEAAIRHLVEGRGRLLVVEKTGWGKSFVYFIATRLLREEGSGPAILISPLPALMRNQIEAAGWMGVRAWTIHSGNIPEWISVEERIGTDEVDVLLISPERLSNERFQSKVLAETAPRVAMLVIDDEAHCISDWGHDFRPDYRLVERIMRRLPTGLQLLATTATANDRVVRDLVDVLGPDMSIRRGDLNRASLMRQSGPQEPVRTRSRGAGGVVRPAARAGTGPVGGDTFLTGDDAGAAAAGPHRRCSGRDGDPRRRALAARAGSANAAARAGSRHRRSACHAR